MTMRRPDNAELEAAFNLLREIYWREYDRGWREAITKIKNIAADEGQRDGNGEHVSETKEG